MGKRLITPAVAKEWLGEYNTDNYRPLVESQAEKFARDMRQNNWRYIKGQTIKFDTNGVLIDGQKRLRAIVISETTQPFNVENDYEPEDKYYLDLGKSRTLGNTLRNLGFKDPNNISAAIKLDFDVQVFRQGRNPNNPVNQATPHEVINAAQEDDKVVYAASSTHGIPRNIMRRSVAIYCYKVLHDIEPYECAEFFHKLVELDHLDDVKDKAIKLLHKRLLYGTWTAKGKTERLQIVAMVFRAWNAWRTQEHLDRLLIASADINKLTMVEPV